MEDTQEKSLAVDDENAACNRPDNEMRASEQHSPPPDDFLQQEVKDALRKLQMTKVHKGVLERLAKTFETQLCSIYTLLQFLYVEQILEENERKELEKLSENQESENIAVRCLLRILPRKSDYAYKAFRQGIIIYCGQPNLVKCMDDAFKDIENRRHSKDCFDTFGVSSVPDYYVSRKNDIESVVKKLDQNDSQTVGIVGGAGVSNSDSSEESNSEDEQQETIKAKMVGVRGLGGVGKTILALKVSELMKKKLPVVWLTVGRKPNTMFLMKQLHIALEGKPDRFNNCLASACDWLRGFSATRFSFLLVLDDVWSVRHVAPFKCIMSPSKVLITSRDEKVLLDLGASIYKLDPLDLQQARRLLFKTAGFKPKKTDENFENIVEDILILLAGLPLAIVMVGSSLKGKTSRLEAWNSLYNRMVAVKERFWADRKRLPGDEYMYPHETIYEAFEVSFQDLNPELKGSHDSNPLCLIQKRFLDLAIFPGTIDVPSNVLRKLWDHELQDKSETDSFEMWDHLEDLEDKSFITLSRKHNGISFYRIHDLLRDYARYKLCKNDPNGLKHAHEKLLRCYENDMAERGLWWSVQNDGYFYHYLSHHLLECGRYKELRNLLWHIEWLEQKLHETDITSVLSDFNTLKQIDKLTDGEVPVTDEDKMLKKSLILSSHIVSSAKAQLCSQLIGRLVGHESPSLQDFVSEIQDHIETKSSMLIPDATCLSHPGGYRLRSLRHTSTVICAALSKNKQLLFTLCASGRLRRIDLENDQIKFLDNDSHRHTDMIFTMVLEEDAGYILTASFDKTVRLWPIYNVDGNGFKCFIDHTAPVYTIATISDRKIMISGSGDRTIRVWDVERSLCLSVIEDAHRGWVREVASVRKDSSVIVSVGGETAAIKMWDIDTKKLIRSWIGHEGAVNCVRVSPDSTKIVTGGRHDSLVKVWDLFGKPIVTYRGHQLGILRCFISADSQHVLSGSLDKTVRMWNINTGDFERMFYSHNRTVCAMYLSDDNKLAVTGGEDQLAILWNSDLGDSAEVQPLKRHDLEVTGVTSSPDGSLIVSCSRDKTIKVWDSSTLLLLETLRGHEDRVNCIVVSPNANQPSGMAGVSGGDDGRICVWDLAPVQQLPVHVFRSHSYGVTALCTCSKGRFVFSGSYDNKILVHELTEFSRILELGCHRFSNARHIVVNGSKLLVAFDGSVLTWDIGELLALQSSDSLSAFSISQQVSYSAQDHFDFSSTPCLHFQGFIANFADNKKVRLMNIPIVIENRLLAPHAAHGDLVSAVFARDGSVIWTGSLLGNIGCIDRTIHPVQKHEIPCPLEKPCKVTVIKTSSTGEHLVAGYANGDVWIWSDETDMFVSKPKVAHLTTLFGSVASIDISENLERTLVAISSNGLGPPVGDGTAFDNQQGNLIFTASVDVWNITTRKRLFSLDQKDVATTVLFTSDGERLLVASLDSSIRLWNTVNGDMEREDNSGLYNGVLSLAVDLAEKIYACGGFENFIEVRELSSGKLIKTLSTNEFYHIKNMYITDNNTIVCAFAREYFIEVRIGSGEILFTSFAMQKDSGPVTRIVSPTLAVSNATNCKAKLWDITSGKTLSVLDAGTTRALLCACVMDCGFVVTGSYDKALKVWDVSNYSTPSLVAAFTFEHAVMSVHEFMPRRLVIGLLNGQVCFMRVSGSCM